MATGTKSKIRGRKGRLGKNKHRIAVYYSSGRHYWNKARKLVHHLRRQSDPGAVTALKAQLAAMPLGMQRDFQKQYNVS